MTQPPPVVVQVPAMQLPAVQLPALQLPIVRLPARSSLLNVSTFICVTPYYDQPYALVLTKVSTDLRSHIMECLPE